MHLFTFEPGDGFSYRVLFGRMPSATPLIPYYTIFGIAEGGGEPGMWYTFDTERISEGMFYQSINPWATLNYRTYRTAWRLWLALTGQADDLLVAARLPAWRDDWRRQLPAGAMG